MCHVLIFDFFSLRSLAFLLIFTFFTFLCQYLKTEDWFWCYFDVQRVSNGRKLEFVDGKCCCTPNLVAQKYTKFELVRSFSMHTKPFTVSTHLCAAQIYCVWLFCYFSRFFGFMLFCFVKCVRASRSRFVSQEYLICIKCSGVWPENVNDHIHTHSHTKPIKWEKIIKKSRNCARIIIIYFIWAHQISFEFSCVSFRFLFSGFANRKINTILA